MFYLIGLGLNEKGYSREAYEIISKVDKIYVDSYTVDFPYDIKQLEARFRRKKFSQANREFVESLRILEEARKQDVVLLVYGSPLTATTHITLIEEARKLRIKSEVVQNASVLDAIAETGLQIYKFGKTTSMPNFKADSYLDIVKQNLSIDAHTLILIDIGMDFKSSLERLIKDTNNKKIKLHKIIVCSQLGTDNKKIYYDSVDKLKKLNLKRPFCVVIPGKLHFVEKEILESFKNIDKKL